jgi:hypothetical protein
VARRDRRLDRRRSVRDRVARFVKAIFGRSDGWAPDDPRRDEPAGGIGVREPRRPLRPTLSGAVALEAPPDERRDVRAVGPDSP